MMIFWPNSQRVSLNNVRLSKNMSDCNVLFLRYEHENAGL